MIASKPENLCHGQEKKKEEKGKRTGRNQKIQKAFYET